MNYHRIVGGIVLFALLGCGGGGGGGGGTSSQGLPNSAYLNVLSTVPESGTLEVGTGTLLQATFDDPVDAATLPGNFRVEADGQALSGSFSLSGDATVVTFHPSPATPLQKGKVYQLHVTPGVRSTAGTPLYIESQAPFQTVPLFSASFFPYQGAILVPTNSSFAVWFSRPVNPATVTASSFWVERNGSPLSGTISLALANRVAVFRPSTTLSANSTHIVKVAGGSAGVLSFEGEELPALQSASIQTAAGTDGIAPKLAVTVQEIPTTMNVGLTIPPYGSFLDLSYSDGLFGFINPASLRLTADVDLGSGAPAGTNLLEALPIALYDNSKVRVRIPSTLPVSSYSSAFSGTGADLAGSPASAPGFGCFVAPTTGDNLPMEQVQVCWARFDLDRNGKDGSDFEKDLLVYGLTAQGDPIGKNAYLRALIEQGVVGWANKLFQTSTWGRVIVSSTEPGSALYMKIAVGGLDPSGDDDYGGSSTAVLGRAIYDAQNQNYADDDTVLNPPLGVFPGEMFNAYIQPFGPGGGDLLFSSTYTPVCPTLGGTAVGAHALDPIILDPAFSYGSAPPDQQARYNAVFNAINRFTKVVGFLLAHEVAHSLGLVPDSLKGFFFHNALGGATDVLLGSVSFTTIVLLDVKFRPLNLGYLNAFILNNV